MNLVKGATTILSQGGTQSNWPGYLDANGYPQGDIPTNIRWSCTTVPQTEYSGDYWIEWDGSVSTGGQTGLQVNGLFGLHTVVTDTNSNVVTGGASTSGVFLGGSNGRVRFTPPAGTTGINITCTGASSSVGTANFVGSGFSNLKLYRHDQKTEMDAGEIFNPDYIALLRDELNPKVLRTGLSWGNANGNIISRWDYEPPVAALSYRADYFVPGIWAGAASFDSGTDTYTVSEPTDWNGLVDGAMVQFYVNTGHDNLTVLPKLVVGTHDPVPIFRQYLSRMETSGDDIEGNGPLTLVYVADLNVFIPRGDFGINGGFMPRVPVQIQCELGNKLSRAVWFIVPHLYDNVSMQTFVETIRDTLDPGLTAHLEFTNESGSFGSAWTQTYYCWRMGSLKGFPRGSTNSHAWYAYRQRELFEIANDVWTVGGRSRSTLKTEGASLIYHSLSSTRDQRHAGQDLTLDANDRFTTGDGGDISCTGGTGGVSNSTLTVTGTPSGTIRPGYILNGVLIQAYSIGTGGAGTYTLSAPLNIANGTSLTLTVGDNTLPNIHAIGRCSSTTLTIDSVTDGTIEVGHFVNSFVQITGFGTGSGGTGTYTVAAPITITGSYASSNTDIYLTNVNSGMPIVKDYSVAPERPIDYTDEPTIGMYWSGAIFTNDTNRWFAFLSATKIVTGVTTANPPVASSTSHGLVAGQRFALSITHNTGSPKTISTATWSGGVVTVTTASAHGFTNPSTARIVVQGCTPTALNGNRIATITGTDTFTFALTSDPGALTVAGTCYGATPSTLYATVATPVNTNDFAFENIRDAANNYLGDSLAGYAAYSSSQALTPCAPGIYDDMMAALDDFESDDAARMELAYEWMYDDLYGGTRPSGLSYGGGNDGTLISLRGDRSSSIIRYSDWQTGILEYFDKPGVFYEGAWDSFMSSTSSGTTICAVMGYPDTLITRLQAFRDGFSHSHWCQKFVYEFYEMVESFDNISLPAMLNETAEAPARWNVIPENIYEEPFKSWDGACLWSNQRKRFRSV